MKLLCLIVGVLIALQFSFCTGKTVTPLPRIQSFKRIEAKFDLGDASRFDFEVGSAASDGGNRLLISYAKLDRQDGKPLGSFFRVSPDAGSTFGPERKVPGTVQLVERGLAAVSTVSAAGGANLFYARSFDDGATWTSPAQVNDEEGSVRSGWGGGVSFIQSTDSDVYCLWTDRRRGFISLFFSASSDGGHTWGPNQAVEYDFREGEQSSPRLLMGAGGRLIAIWIDWRDRQTLADIRSSHSDDRGWHWSASRKVNDDTEHVWQIAPSAVSLGSKVFVVFQDFREAGEEGDNDWNIYFARSEDGGATWAKNVRVNDVQQGEDSSPRLTIDSGGNLHCTWKTGRDSIFGDIAASHSSDDGRTWSASQILNQGRELTIREPLPVVAMADRLLCLWHEYGFDSSRTRITWLESAAEPTAEVTTTEANGGSPFDSAAAPPGGDAIFSDDFSDGNAAQWQVRSGVWSVVDGALMGVEPASQSAFSAYARIEEPDRYVVRGRFKLDPVAHHIATLYFRWDGERKYYQIINQFRLGVWMGLREGDALGSVPDLTSRPLAQRRFPFQNNRWYEFVLSVAPERVDYFVDGRLMLSLVERLRLPAGRFGIGGGGRAPTYFDNIVIERPAAR